MCKMHINVLLGFLLLNVIIQAQTVLGRYWSPWSPWSPCSVTCNGGLSNQRRRCFGGRLRCFGSNIRYRLCNTNPCQGVLTYQADRLCKLHNTKFSTSGFQSNWIPVSDQSYSCYVICKDQSGSIPNEITTNMDDGTKCGSDENFYCATGKCVRIGCDGVPWSNTVLDGCGVCGGKNTSCSRVHDDGIQYDWRVKWQACSVTCGTGFQKSRSVCLDIKTGEEMLNPYSCNRSRKPRVVYRECSSQKCGPRWEVRSYGPCSVECGGGTQRRQISCVVETSRGRQKEVSPYRCPDPIPVTDRTCNLKFCPTRWETGPWSKCSTTCGLGTQVRPVYCVKTPFANLKVNVSGSECLSARPQTVRACSTSDCFKFGLSMAPAIEIDNSTYYQTKRIKRVNLKVGTHATLLPRQPVKIKCKVENFDEKMIFWTRNNRLISMSTNERVHVTHKGVLKIRRTDPNLDEGKFTCIAGMAKASVYIRFQNKRLASEAARKMIEHMTKKNEISDFINKPQSDKVPGAQDSSAYYNHNIRKTREQKRTFMTSDWSTCSKTCGTGIQTRKVTCSIVADGFIKVVDDMECLHENVKKPSLQRKCIIQTDCPSFRTGEWSMCSTDHCSREGISLQTRDTHCISGNGTKLPMSYCKKLKFPVLKRECPNSKCIPRWTTMEWSSCYPKCSQRRRKSRIISCVWLKSGNSAGSNCKHIPRPIAWKRCKPKLCKKVCRDKSRYCSLVGMLQMCRYGSFKSRCCRTCKSINQIPK